MAIAVNRGPGGRLYDENAPATPFQEWDSFRKWFGSQWEQGQHVTMIGTTGSGKTTLLREIIGFRSYVVIFGVKGRDDSMDKFLKDGYLRLREWNPDIDDYVVLWPDIKGFGHRMKQREVFENAIDSIYRSGGWTVVFDEVSYLADTLKMQENLKFLLQQGRSSGITVIGMTQRPAFIPLAFYDQATHLFVWRDNDHRNLSRIGELSGLASRVVQREVAELREREILYLNTNTGHRVRTIVEV